MSAYLSAYYDLQGMLALFNSKKDNKFQAVIVFPLVRDLCLMVYQINKDLLKDSMELNPAIKKIRHRVKLFQKKNNIQVYRYIVEYHHKQFGNDIDNLGFYFEGTNLKGSTIYTTYIFQDTDFFGSNPIDTKKNIYKFMEELGNTIIEMLEFLKEKIGYDVPEYMYERLTIYDDSRYVDKDVLSDSFFLKDEKTNIFFVRLLTSLQELTTCVWLYEKLSIDKVINIKSYISIRLISIKADEVMDNLNNLRRFFPIEFLEFNSKSEDLLSQLMDEYTREIAEECSNLRNMVHYDVSKENFLEYIEDKVQEDENFILSFQEKVIKKYVEQLSSLISNYLNVYEVKSMTDWQKIRIRLISLLKRKDIKGSRYDL